MAVAEETKVGADPLRFLGPQPHQRKSTRAPAVPSRTQAARDAGLTANLVPPRSLGRQRARRQLREIEPAKNQHEAKRRACAPAVIGRSPSRSQAAREAGLSDRQRVTALRVASAPRRVGTEARRRAWAPEGPSRSAAARDAGLSDKQRKTALRVAAVPRESFERQIESDDPPTVTELARQGTKRKAMRDSMARVVAERPEIRLRRPRRPAPWRVGPRARRARPWRCAGEAGPAASPPTLLL